MKRVMTPELRKKFAGFLPFSEGASARLTPPGLEDLPDAPFYLIGPYSPAGLKKRRARPEGMGAIEHIVSLFKDGEALHGWGNVPNMETGEEIPYEVEKVPGLESSEPLVLWIDARALEFNLGEIKPEEKEGLGSSPAST